MDTAFHSAPFASFSSVSLPIRPKTPHKRAFPGHLIAPPAHLPLTLSQKHLHSSEPKETPVRLIVGTRDTEKTAEEGEGPVVVCLVGDKRKAR